jgi:hypothetical protein
MTDIANDLRAECARIIRRYYDVTDAIAPIRVDTVKRIDAYVADTSDRLAACTCQPAPEFTIPTRRDRPVHAMFLARRLERMRVEDAR